MGIFRSPPTTVLSDASGSLPLAQVMSGLEEADKDGHLVLGGGSQPLFEDDCDMFRLDQI